MHSTLTDRQERFVIEYLKDQNASAAAGRAGYTARNLAAQGSELMNNPAVRHRVRAGMQSLLAELRCSALSLMRHRMRAAFFRADQMFMHGWEPYALDEMDEDTRRALEVTVTMRKSGPVVRMRQPCRARALRALEKAHETLDRLNEQYYAKLERSGTLPDAQELERLEEEERAEMGQGAEDAPADSPPTRLTQKPQVLSGSEPDAPCRTASFDRLRTNGEGSVNFPEKPQVLSGSPLAPAPQAEQEPENHQVLSGLVVECSVPHGVLRQAQDERSSGRECEFPEKPQVLSGSQRTARDALETA